MARLTTTMTIDTLGEAISPDIDCDKLTIREHGAAGTTEWDIYMPDAVTGSAVPKAAGEPHVFERNAREARFAKGRPLATGKTVSGSVTFDKIHE